MAGKPRVVYLDVDDEITSAASRIRRADAPRVALVVPPGSRVSTSRINFRLLAREALESGRQLSIVAPDAASRSLAAAAGLEVFRTVGEYETADAEATARAAEDRAAEDRAAEGGAGVPGAQAGRARPDTSAAPGSAPAPGAAPAAAAGPAAAAAAAVAAEKGTALDGVPGRGAARGSAPGAGAAGTPATTATTATTALPRQADTADLRPRSNVAGVRTMGGTAEGRSRRRLLIGSLVALVLLVAVVGGVAAYLLLPQATIVVVPKVEPIGPVQATITADPNATAVDVAAGIVPAQHVSFPVQANGTFKATGQKVDETKATGTVTFSSTNTVFDVPVAAGTKLSTNSGIAFVVTKDVTVPKAVATLVPPSFTPGRADAPVQAVKSGPSGNVPAHTIVSQPATLSLYQISVNNNAPTSGGSRTVTPKVAQADVDAALAALRQELQAGFQQDLQAGTGVPSGATLFPQTGALGGPTFSADPTSLVGQLVPQFGLGATATGTATAVDERPVSTVAEARLRSQVRSGYDLVAGSVRVSVGEPTVNGEQVTFPATGSASEVRRLDAAALEAKVRGLPVDQARQVLAPYGTVDIATWPDWVSTIPTYDFRVDLKVQPSAAVEASPGAGSSSATGSAAPSGDGTAGSPSPSAGSSRPSLAPS